MLEYSEVTKPYPGLRPFEPWEGANFFGRESHTDRLLEILQGQHFLAVIGPSGSGKSSLVRAGLLPALPLGSLGTGSDWRIAIMRPGNKPMQRLAQALLTPSVLGRELVGAERIPENELDITADVALVEAELRRGPRGLIDLVADARTKAPEATDCFNLLVLADQFEEIFTYVQAGEREADESEAFVNLLLAARAAEQARIFVVLTMRTDFLGHCVRFLDLPDAINRAQYLTPRLSREQIEQAIRGPARVFGGDIESSLVAELINAVGNDPDQLPILQHALARMWESAARRDPSEPDVGWDDFKQIGGIQSALSDHAQEVWNKLGPEGQQAAAWFFRAITEERTPESGGQAVRRPQSLARIATWSGRDWRDFVPVAEAYAHEDVSFINYSGPLGEDTVIDISHEALIRQWPGLRRLVEKEALLASEYRRWRERAQADAEGRGAPLAGADLARAVEWREGRFIADEEFPESWRPNPQWAGRYTNPGANDADTEFASVLAFIDRSYQVVMRKNQRERILKRVLIGLTAACLLLAGGAFWSAYQARVSWINAEAQLLWHPLDFTYLSGDVSLEQGNGLLKTARTGRRLKEGFLRQIARNSAIAGRFNHRPNEIIRAAVGTSLDLRPWVLDAFSAEVPGEEFTHAERVARVMVILALEGQPVLEDYIAALSSVEDVKQKQVLTQGLPVLVKYVSEDEVRSLAKVFVDAVGRPSDWQQQAAMGQVLAAAAVKLSEGDASALARRLVEAIGTLKTSFQLKEVGRLLGALPVKLAATQAGIVTKVYVDAIGSTTAAFDIANLGEGLGALPLTLTATQSSVVINAFVTAIHSATRSGRQDLGEPLAAMAPKVPEAEVDDVAKLFVDAITSATDSYEIGALGQGLGALPVKLTETEAVTVTKTFVDAIGSTENPTQLATLGQVLSAAAGKLSGGGANGLARRLVDTIGSTVDYSKLQALQQGLAAVAGKVSEEEAGAVAKRMVKVIGSTENYAQHQALGAGLTGIAEMLTEGDAGAMAQDLVYAIMTNEAYSRIEALKRGLAAVHKVAETESSVIAKDFIDAIGSTTNSYQLAVLGQGLGALPLKLTGPEARAVAKRFIDAIASPTVSFELAALGQGLGALPVKLTAPEARAVVKRFIDAIGSATDSFELQALGQALAAVARKVPEAEAGAAAKGSVDAISHETNSFAVEALGLGLAALAGRIKMDEASIAPLFEAMKLPGIPRKDLLKSMRAQFPDAPPAERGFWAFIEWAHARFPSLALESPPKGPEPIRSSFNIFAD